MGRRRRVLLAHPGSGRVGREGPEAYIRDRTMDAERVWSKIAEKGGRAIALKADLGDVGARQRACLMRPKPH